MSTEKNPEIVGCDASIMRNVWEIREREYGQKIQLEQERIENSSLPAINKVWQDRLNARLGKAKYVGKKNKPTENQTDNDNVWKSKQLQVPPTLPRGRGSGLLDRPGGQRKGISTPAHKYNDKKGEHNNLNRLQLLMFLNQSQPSAMVWGKSWKYSKSLPPSEEGAGTSDWGRCWMFATLQPYSEPGKPWLNGPNKIDPQSLCLLKKPHYQLVKSQELDFGLSTEWQESWKKSDKNTNEENIPKSGLFTMLVETQQHLPEWNESWRSTKPTNQQKDFTITNHGQTNSSIANKQDKSSTWEECWRFINHHGCNKSSPVQSEYADWTNSWRAATANVNSSHNSDPYLRQDHNDTDSQKNESHFCKLMNMSHEEKYKDLSKQLSNDFKALLEWNKSWQVTKNNSKPCEEIEKVLKVSSSKTVTAMEKMKESATGYCSTPTDPCYEQLKHNVIFQPKTVFTQNKTYLKPLNNSLSASEWRESWKTLKHRMSDEERRMRPDLSRHFKGMKPKESEWKLSWKSTSQSLRQEPEMWQHGWPTMPQIRVDRARTQNHFAPVELPKNGPTGERCWRESWRSFRSQHRPEHAQSRTQSSHDYSGGASHRHNDTLTHRSARRTDHVRSVSDWQEAWMVSETQFHHDKPSLTQWGEAWKCSYYTEHQSEQLSRDNGVDVLMIKCQKDKISLQKAHSKMSRSFDTQIFKERYPDKQWSNSWKVGSPLSLQGNHGSSDITGMNTSSTTQQQHVTMNEKRSEWGMSFRLANPMPHVELPWVESPPNPCHYTAIWLKQKNMQNRINTNFSNDLKNVRLWGRSHQFTQGASAKIKEPVDPRVIITRKTQTRRHLYPKKEKENQSERKWAGCHLLGKTQPRPKKGPSVKKLQMTNKSNDSFLEEWSESWRFSFRPGSLKKQMSIKTLSEWQESWKFLLPPYMPMNGPKAK